MITPIRITTQRLQLREWWESDREPYADMNADPMVMRFFAGLMTREASDRELDGWQSGFDARGWGNWVVETRETASFIGYVGLSIPRRVLPFTPCVELGYRLARAHWGKGYATEGARAALRVGFEHVGLEEIVSFTPLVNLPSRAVMERVGMVNANEDFDHPNPALPDGSELKRMCLYRLSRERWLGY
ncbi:GNAT family N-acetyltransferase [Variovorax saccharolyticus]|uniref:GNAT family N-acetyltransferase n=1 Tax=Variovorax saccharolyticus TaxID=3053516 RepID=UPI0025785B39|nr:MULTISPECIES: GNAT family N-acetyltransferase [unclassified Variovorax]MDM0017149.1 GNAT family N-acetyltransferase [Variovorax sp. J22R187]MDM0029317.1 GNAT family N-acetyltransferase [Variovorax sp. J31P216]